MDRLVQAAPSYTHSPRRTPPPLKLYVSVVDGVTIAAVLWGPQRPAHLNDSAVQRGIHQCYTMLILVPSLTLATVGRRREADAARPREFSRPPRAALRCPNPRICHARGANSPVELHQGRR